MTPQELADKNFFLAIWPQRDYPGYSCGWVSSFNKTTGSCEIEGYGAAIFYPQKILWGKSALKFKDRYDALKENYAYAKVEFEAEHGDRANALFTDF